MHVASKQAQVRGACREKPIRPQVGQFNAGRERITACTVEPRTNGTTPSLLWILCQAATHPNNTHQIKSSNRFSCVGRQGSRRCTGIDEQGKNYCFNEDSLSMKPRPRIPRGSAAR